MNTAQRAVLEAAKKAGRSPMEQASEFMLHDLVQAVLDVLKAQTKVYSSLSEQQMDAVIGKVTDTLKPTVLTACSIIASEGRNTIRMQLTGFKTGKEIQVTGKIEHDDPGRYELMDKANEKASVSIIVQDQNYFSGMDNIQSDKDQKPLDLEGEGKPASTKPASKGKGKTENPEKKIEVAPKMLTDARDFIIIQQNPTVAGLQNFLHIDRTKAEYIHSLMEDEGVITAKDASGMRQLVRKDSNGTSGGDLDEQQTDLDAQLTGEDTPVKLTEELYQAVMASVIKRQAVSVSGLMVEHALPEETVLDAIDRLELDEVISTEDDMGGRQVLVAQASE
jgi:hypothetical protein